MLSPYSCLQLPPAYVLRTQQMSVRQACKCAFGASYTNYMPFFDSQALNVTQNYRAVCAAVVEIQRHTYSYMVCFTIFASEACQGLSKVWPFWGFGS